MAFLIMLHSHNIIRVWKEGNPDVFMHYFQNSYCHCLVPHQIILCIKSICKTDDWGVETRLQSMVWHQSTPKLVIFVVWCGVSGLLTHKTTYKQIVASFKWAKLCQLVFIVDFCCYVISIIGRIYSHVACFVTTEMPFLYSSLIVLFN